MSIIVARHQLKITNVIDLKSQSVNNESCYQLIQFHLSIPNSHISYVVVSNDSANVYFVSPT